MTMNNNSISKVGLLLTLSVLLGACGGGKKEVAAEPTSDITRPPLIEKVSAPQEEAVAEGETISFDEWRKRREAEKKQDQ